MCRAFREDYDGELAEGPTLAVGGRPDLSRFGNETQYQTMRRNNPTYRYCSRHAHAWLPYLLAFLDEPYGHDHQRPHRC